MVVRRKASFIQEEESLKTKSPKAVFEIVQEGSIMSDDHHQDDTDNHHYYNNDVDPVILSIFSLEENPVDDLETKKSSALEAPLYENRSSRLVDSISLVVHDKNGNDRSDSTHPVFLVARAHENHCHVYVTSGRQQERQRRSRHVIVEFDGQEEEGGETIVAVKLHVVGKPVKKDQNLKGGGNNNQEEKSSQQQDDHPYAIALLVLTQTGNLYVSKNQNQILGDGLLVGDITPNDQQQLPQNVPMSSLLSSSPIKTFQAATAMQLLLSSSSSQQLLVGMTHISSLTVPPPYGMDENHSNDDSISNDNNEKEKNKSHTNHHLPALCEQLILISSSKDHSSSGQSPPPPFLLHLSTSANNGQDSESEVCYQLQTKISLQGLDSVQHSITSTCMMEYSRLSPDFCRLMTQRLWSMPQDDTISTNNKKSDDGGGGASSYDSDNDNDDNMEMDADVNKDDADKQNNSNNNSIVAILFLGCTNGSIWAVGISRDHQQPSTTTADEAVPESTLVCSKAHLIGWLSEEQPITEIMPTTTPTEKPTVLHGMVDGMVVLGSRGHVAHMSSLSSSNNKGAMQEWKPMPGSGPGSSWSSALAVPMLDHHHQDSKDGDKEDGANANAEKTTASSNILFLWATNTSTGATHYQFYDRQDPTGCGISTSGVLPIRSDLSYILPIPHYAGQFLGKKKNGDFAPYHLLGITKQGGIVGFQVPIHEHSMDDWLCSSYGGADDNLMVEDDDMDLASILANLSGSLRQSALRNQALPIDPQERVKEVGRKRVKKYTRRCAQLEAQNNDEQVQEKDLQQEAFLRETAKATNAVLDVQKDIYNDQLPLVTTGRVEENAHGIRVATVQVQNRRTASNSTNSIDDLDVAVHVLCPAPQKASSNEDLGEGDGAPVRYALEGISSELDLGERDGVPVQYGGVAYSVYRPNNNSTQPSETYQFELPPKGEGQIPHGNVVSYLSMTPRYAEMGCDRELTRLVDDDDDGHKRTASPANRVMPQGSGTSHHEPLRSIVTPETPLPES